RARRDLGAAGGDHRARRRGSQLCAGRSGRVRRRAGRRRPGLLRGGGDRARGHSLGHGGNLRAADGRGPAAAGPAARRRAEAAMTEECFAMTSAAFLPSDGFVGFALAGVLDATQCEELIGALTRRGFSPTGGAYPRDYRDNDRLVFDDAELAARWF